MVHSLTVTICKKHDVVHSLAVTVKYILFVFLCILRKPKTCTVARSELYDISGHWRHHPWVHLSACMTYLASNIYSPVFAMVDGTHNSGVAIDIMYCSPYYCIRVGFTGHIQDIVQSSCTCDGINLLQTAALACSKCCLS